MSLKVWMKMSNQWLKQPNVPPRIKGGHNVNYSRGQMMIDTVWQKRSGRLECVDVGQCKDLSGIEHIVTLGVPQKKALYHLFSQLNARRPVVILGGYSKLPWMVDSLSDHFNFCVIDGTLILSEMMMSRELYYDFELHQKPNRKSKWWLMCVR